MEIIKLINKLLEPDTLMIIMQIVIAVLYLTGRITKSQFIIEQKKAKGLVKRRDARKKAAEHAIYPITATLDILDCIPVINTRLPMVNKSLPILIKDITVTPISLISDIIFNFPFFGTKTK